jgi:FemAB-related protein (PEP-CTERM system-associated)
MEQADMLGASHAEFRDDIARKELPARTDKVNMILLLPESPEALWQSFTPKLRAQIRRPQQEDPQVLQGGAALLDDFYSVFSRNMRDLGTPVYGKNFFRTILETFPQSCYIVVIRHSDRPVAAGFLIGHRDTLEIPWASSLREVNRLSMNMLLYQEALKLAIARGYRQFDFGRSSRDSGTYRFKQQWGAQPRELHWHYWLADDSELPALNPDNPRYALAIRLWQRLPLQIANALGPRIVKNLP